MRVLANARSCARARAQSSPAPRRCTIDWRNSWYHQSWHIADNAQIQCSQRRPDPCGKDLEADYNDALSGLAKAREDYERQRKTDQLELTNEAVARVRGLATDFPRLWNEPTTPARERKRMVRLIIEDATLTKSAEGVKMQVRFRGGATRTVMVPRSLASWETWQTSPEVIELIDQLLDDHTNAEVAAILNERGYTSGQGKRFHGHRIKYLIRAHRLQPRFARLAARGLLTTDELAARLNTSPKAVRQRRREGTLTLASYRLDDNGRHMFEPPRTP